MIYQTDNWIEIEYEEYRKLNSKVKSKYPNELERLLCGDSLRRELNWSLIGGEGILNWMRNVEDAKTHELTPESYKCYKKGKGKKLIIISSEAGIKAFNDTIEEYYRTYILK